MTREERALIYFKDLRERKVEDYSSVLDTAPKESVVYKAVSAEIEIYDTAIKALEQERSRSAEITQYRYDCEKLMEENERLKKALEQEPCGDVTTFKEDVLDAIGRIGLQKSGTKEVQAVAECLRAVEALPPVNPQESFKPMVEIDLYSVIKQKYIEREVLDKIRAEIFNACSDNYHMPVYKLSCEEIFEIIDKYKMESEEKE